MSQQDSPIQQLLSPFRLRVEETAGTIMVTLQPGWRRLARLLVVCVVPSAALGILLPWDAFRDLSPTLPLLWVGWGVWERYRLEASVQAPVLSLTVRPLILGWYAPPEINLSGVIRVRKSRVFAALVLERQDGNSYAFFLGPLVTLNDGRNVYDLVAALANDALLQPPDGSYS